MISRSYLPPFIAPSHGMPSVPLIATQPHAAQPLVAQSHAREPAPSRVAHISSRDLRIDFFRGLALLWIFLNHIPGNTLSWLTSRNYGLSDATEVFVFLAGISCTMAYGKILDQKGLASAWKAGGRRAFSIYHSHLVTVFVLLGVSMGLALVSIKSDPLAYNLFSRLVETTREGDFSLYGQLFALSYRPMNMDVLPLYVVLLGFCVPMLWLAKRHPFILAIGSIVLWAMAKNGLNMPDYRPDHGWVFNPFAWQLLFVSGMLTALHGHALRPVLDRKRIKILAILVLMACSAIVLSWYVKSLSDAIPLVIAEWIYPLSKMNLDLLRLAHFAAVLVLVVPLLPASAAWLKSRIAGLFIVCGRHSLQVFSFGIVLSFLGRVVLSEISSHLALQALVSASGCAILMGQAAWLERRGRQKKGAQNTSGRTLQGVAG